jgi:hypothetical protein
MLLAFVGGPGVLGLQKDCDSFAGFEIGLNQVALEEEESIAFIHIKLQLKKGLSWVTEDT